MTCSPWFDPSDPDQVAAFMPCCDPDGVSPALLEVKVAEASHLLNLAVGGMWPGRCEDTIRPCGACCGVQWLAYTAAGGARPLPLTPQGGFCGCGCGGLGGTGCTATGIRLPRQPVLAVDEVKIDGQVVDPAEYRLSNGVLLRSDGSGWPTWQDLGRPDTDPRTFSIRYSWGGWPPLAGKIAAGALACELVKACTGGPCRLPERVQSITREGVTMTMLDPMEYLVDGRLGLPAADRFIALTRSASARRSGRVLNPDMLGVHDR